MKSTKIEQAFDLVKSKGVVRPRDLAAEGIRREYLLILQRRGQVERIGRGLYVAVDTQATEHHSLAEAAKRIPRGVVCLLSALTFHRLTTQNPSQIWMAIGEKTWQPEQDIPLIKTVRFSGAALEYGIEEHMVEGVIVRVYSPAKTVADCFKYRNKIGLDVALEALRDCWRQRKATMDELWMAAEVCRMAKVMQPYMEALI